MITVDQKRLTEIGTADKFFGVVADYLLSIFQVTHLKGVRIANINDSDGAFLDQVMGLRWFDCLIHFRLPIPMLVVTIAQKYAEK